MRVISISGTMDSGKTTAIKSIIPLLVAQQKRCAVIVNEDGQETYDDAFIKDMQLSIEYLRGG